MLLEDLFKLFDKNYLLDDITIDEIILNKRKIEKNCYDCIFGKVNCSLDYNSWLRHKELHSKSFLNQEVAIRFLGELDEEEKKYLSSIINPFRSRVASIAKMRIDDEYSCIKIQVIVPSLSTKVATIYDNIFLPRFKTDKKYLGMDQYQSYNLEELEL